MGVAASPPPASSSSSPAFHLASLAISPSSLLAACILLCVEMIVVGRGKRKIMNVVNTNAVQGIVSSISNEY